MFQYGYITDPYTYILLDHSRYRPLESVLTHIYLHIYTTQRLFFCFSLYFWYVKYVSIILELP